MQMRELRCKTPDLVHKEVWAHILAYNLIRTVMAQAAVRHEIVPRTISFKGTLQTLEAFQPLLELGAAWDAARQLRLCHDLLDAIATHRVADRPDRYEPRLKKHRRHHYDWMTKPRAELKLTMAKGVAKNSVPFVCRTDVRGALGFPRAGRGDRSSWSVFARASLNCRIPPPTARL
jgi:hypothetical protein